MSRSSSNTEFDNDTVMSDVYHYEGDSEMSRSSSSTQDSVQKARPRSIHQKKAALKAADDVNKHATASKKRSIKTVKNKKKASANRTPSVPARNTRSTTRSQPDASQHSSTHIVDSPTIEIAQPTTTKTTWLPEEKAALEDALVLWWNAKGAAQYNHPTKMVLPDKKKSNPDWDWILAQCKALDESFDRGRDGLITIAGKINPLPPIGES